MIRAITITLALAILCGAADAQSPGRLLLCADETRTECAIVNDHPEVVTIHMFVVSNGGETANTVGFYAPTPSCWTGAIFLGDEINDDYLFLGGTHDAVYGVAITFRGCRELPVRLGSMSFWAVGSEPCCRYDVQGMPNSGKIELVDCASGLFEAPYTSVTINPGEDCECGSSSPLATEETTWGQLKALYR
jgi:hypothetical protein